MKKSIIWGVLLMTAGFSPAFSQETAAVTMTAETTYAVNRNNSINVQDNRQDPQDRDDDALKVRNVVKTFPADRSDKIMLSNMFGSMIIKVWDRREVKIDITIRAYSNNDKQAQELIDQVQIDAGKSGDNISCKTTIDNGGSRWSGRNKRREVKVAYVVYLPASNALTLSQQFGNVVMGDFSGPLSAKVQYGDFTAGNLSDTNNYLSVQYGKANIEELNKASVKQQYGSGLTIGTVGTLDLDAQYAGVTISMIKGDAVIKQQYGSGLKIGSVGNLDLDVQYASVNVGTVKGSAVIKQQYNSLTLGSVGKISLRSQYTGVTIGNLKGDGTFKMSYNHFTVTEVSPACRRLTVDADYVNLNLGFGNSFNGDFNLQKSYGGFNYDNNVKVLSSTDNEENRSSSNKRYSGKIGNGGSSSVQIDAAYGSVTFK